MWNWLKRLLGIAEKEYHQLLDQAHKLHDDIADFVDQKEAKADDIRDKIEAHTQDLAVTSAAIAAAEDLRKNIVAAISPALAAPVKADAPADGHANVAAQ